MTDKKVTRIEKRELKRKFWFDLTKEEESKLGKDAAALHAEIKADGEALAAIKKEWNAKIKTKIVEHDRLSTIQNTGKECREVDAIEVRDYGKKEVRYMFGKKVMETREMNADELQTTMQLEKRQAERAEHAEEVKAQGTEQKLRDQAEEFQKKRKSAKQLKSADEITEVIREETSKLTKKSSVDAPTAH